MPQNVEIIGCHLICKANEVHPHGTLLLVLDCFVSNIYCNIFVVWMCVDGGGWSKSCRVICITYLCHTFKNAPYFASVADATLKLRMLYNQKIMPNLIESLSIKSYLKTIFLVPLIWCKAVNGNKCHPNI